MSESATCCQRFFSCFESPHALAVFLSILSCVLTVTPRKIHVHSQTDKSTLGYLQMMWETMLSLANRPELLQLTCHCIGPAAADRLGVLSQTRTVVVAAATGDDMHGSNGHGACVEDAIRMTDDGDIHIICDADTVVIAKGWDDYVRIRLMNDGIGIIGATYEDPGGFSSGGGDRQTYKNIPNAVWMALSPNHNWRELKAKPRKDKPISITTPEVAATYNLPVGHQVLCDVGWQIPQYLRDHKIKYDGWRQLKPSKSARVLSGLSDYHEEYNVTGNIPFLVHHRGSMRHSYRNDKMSKRFYEVVDVHLEGEHKATTRWTWEWHVTTDISTPEPIQIEEQKVLPLVVDSVSEPVRTFKDEWTKISFNGVVTKPRGRLEESRLVHADNPTISSTQVGHLRVEGSLRSEARVTIAGASAEPYAITFRNTTGHDIHVSSGAQHSVRVPASETMWLLIDVDGVQRVI